jgi:ferredoxin-fold anticodon binding domain-containing protein
MKGNGRLEKLVWGNVFTNSQMKEMEEKTVGELKKLIQSPAVSDIYKGTEIKIGVGGNLTLNSRGLFDDLLRGVKEEEYFEVVKKWGVTPAELQKIRKQIETPLSGCKRKK